MSRSRKQSAAPPPRHQASDAFPGRSAPRALQRVAARQHLPELVQPRPWPRTWRPAREVREPARASVSEVIASRRRRCATGSAIDRPRLGRRPCKEVAVLYQVRFSSPSMKETTHLVALLAYALAAKAPDLKLYTLLRPDTSRRSTRSHRGIPRHPLAAHALVSTLPAARKTAHLHRPCRACVTDASSSNIRPSSRVLRDTPPEPAASSPLHKTSCIRLAGWTSESALSEFAQRHAVTASLSCMNSRQLSSLSPVFRTFQLVDRLLVAWSVAAFGPPVWA